MASGREVAVPPQRRHFSLLPWLSFEGTERRCASSLSLTDVKEAIENRAYGIVGIRYLGVYQTAATCLKDFVSREEHLHRID